MIYWGMKTTHIPTYNSYKSMRARCRLGKDNTKNHGDRGITVCKRWESYNYFVRDMGKRPVGTTLDRIDNDKSYKPSNCRWADWKTQHNNKRTNVLVKKDGIVNTISEWCDFLQLTKVESSKVYKRHSKYLATSYEELFSSHLRTHRALNRVNKCLYCNTTKTCKWRKNGKQCNTCWSQDYRLKKKT